MADFAADAGVAVKGGDAANETPGAHAGEQVVSHAEVTAIAPLQSMTSESSMMFGQGASQLALMPESLAPPLPIRNTRMSVVTEWVFREITLEKREGTEFGMDITLETDGMEVAEVIPGGLVALEGTIRPGDRLLCINNTPLLHMTQEKAASILRDAVGPVKLTAACRLCGDDTFQGKEPTVATEFLIDNVEMTPVPGEGFGMDIETDETSTTVTSILPGGAADRCGQLRVGDIVLSINGTPLVAKQPQDVIKMFQEASGKTKFVVAGPNTGHPRHKTVETHSSGCTIF